MKICFIGKYPPIQGGVSQDSFWTTYALAQKGFEIQVVTNAQEVEYPFRLFEDPSFMNPLDSLPAPNGGKVILHSSSDTTNQRNYIPWANPFVTKLATIATDAIEAHGCDLIYSYYFEPYALSAYLASQWTGVPYGIRHAGSDVGRLFQSHEQRTAYTKVIRAADYVLPTASTFRRFLQLGVDLEKLYTISSYSLPTDYFCPTAPALEINQYSRSIQNAFPRSNYQGLFHQFADKPFDPSLPTIGIYGKTGRTKGSFDLLRALSRLRRTKVKFNFLALTQGHMSTVFEFVQAIKEYSLEDVTWLLPFIPHWYIPRFVRSCTAVCFLERDFPVSIHHPVVPREVFACGTSLILSHEIANKQIYRDRLSDRSNVFLVNPLDTDELIEVLRTVLNDPGASREVGMRGYKEISSGLEDFAAHSDKLAASFNTIYEDIRGRRALMSLSEMQACLARLYVDKPFRKIFEINENTALQDYKLTEEEKHSIRNIDKKMLEYFAGSLINKRKKRIQSAYPLLFQLLGPDIDRYYHRYYHLYQAKPYEPFLQQVLDFGEFMEQSLASDEDTVPYASNLACYEKLCFAAKFSPSPQDTLAMVNERSSQPLPPLSQDARPLIRPGVQLVTFRYNVDKIASDLRNQLVPHALQPGNYYMLFQQVPNMLTPNIFSLSPAVGQLLSFCDGNHTIPDLAQEMAHTLGRSNLEAVVQKIVSDMYTLNIIGV